MAFAPVTRLLIVANVLVYSIVYFTIGDSHSYQIFLNTYGLAASFYGSGEIWQPITSMFIHGIFPFHLHILVNMIALYSLGLPIERTIGSWRFSWLYGVSGLCSALAVVLFSDSTQPTVGASGAIFGLLGALAIFYPNSMLLVFFIPMRARTAAFLLLAASLVFMFTNKLEILSHLGHAGGLVGGLLYSRFVLGMNRGQQLHAGPAAGAAGSHIFRSRKEEMQSRINQIFERKSARTVINPQTGREEKIINPSDQDFEDQVETEQGQKRLYFDPGTGRFFFK